MHALSNVSRDIFSWMTRRETANDVALKISVLYVFLGVGWCLLDHNVYDRELAKDLIFYGATAWLLYFLISHGIETIRRTESALRETQDRMARIVDTNVAGIVVADTDGRITFLNAAAESMLGVSSGDVVGRNVREYLSWISDSDGAPILADDLPLARVLQKGKPVHDREVAVTPPGRQRFILSVNAAPLFDGDAEAVGMVASFSDITERKIAQDLNLRKLSLAMVHSPVGIVMCDVSGRVEYANPRFAEITGYGLEELHGREALCPTEEAPEACRQVCRAVADGNEWSGKFPNRRKNGDRYWVSASITPVRNGDGALTGFLWIMEDITQHRRADEALRDSEERFRQLFVQNEEPILLFKAGTAEIADANPAAVRLYGYTREALVAGGPSLFVPPEARAELEARIRAIGESTWLNVEKMLQRRRDGEEIIVSVRGHAIKLPEGAVSFCTFRDITMRTRLEEEARQSQAQLIHANRMASLGTVVSGVAHEINNPNNLVMFNAPIIAAAWSDIAQVLEDHYRDKGDFSVGGIDYTEMRDAIPRLLDGISDAARRIKDIVGNLKDFTRPSASTGRCAVGVNDVVRKALAILNHEILKGTHGFHVEYSEDLPPVMGCAQELEQVVVNLVNNALQALPGPSAGIRVSTSADREGRWVEITVRDEGRGMTNDVLERVAEPFFTTRGDSGGLGLGLSICQSILKAHDGTLAFKSEPGKGTTVTCRLPGVGAVVAENVGVAVG